jgi:hypothetical protein
MSVSKCHISTTLFFIAGYRTNVRYLDGTHGVGQAGLIVDDGDKIVADVALLLVKLRVGIPVQQNTKRFNPQSGQSTKLSLHSFELGLPYPPHMMASVYIRVQRF